MRRRTFMLLAGSLGASLTACTTGRYAPAGPGYQPGPIGLAPGALPRPSSGGAGPVGILLPLSGARAGLGEPLLQAAQLALAAPGAPALLQQDTGGTAQGAIAGAQAAIAGGARLLLGPLTAPEVAAAAPLARQAGVPMLAFSNDPAVAQPGVWPLGITPGQQVRRVLAAARQAGRSRVAALLPDSDFGRAMATALGQAATASGMPPPTIRFHGHGMSAINQAARALSDYDTRWGPVQQQIRAARAEGTAEGRRRAEQLAKSALPPPPFDALLLADTGEALAEISAVLPYYFITQPAVQILGPTLWADPRSLSRDVPGAWYAAPDPAAREPFVQAFSARYGTPPPALADLAYDAAAIARVTAGDGYSTGALTASSGFSGADGWLALLPGGEVHRGLALFQVEAGGPKLLEPAPVGA